jgi:hypothetical protein
MATRLGALPPGFGGVAIRLDGGGIPHGHGRNPPSPRYDMARRGWHPTLSLLQLACDALRHGSTGLRSALSWPRSAVAAWRSGSTGLRSGIAGLANRFAV